MKSALGIFILLVSITMPALAIHMYLNYDCKTQEGNLFKHDGPGSNYAVGGYSNFYIKGSKNGLLAYQKVEEEEEPSIGEQIGEAGKLEVFFTISWEGTVGSIKKQPVDPKSCEGYEFEVSEWKSRKVIKILKISEFASDNLNLKPGKLVTLNCDNRMEFPIKCDK